MRNLSLAILFVLVFFIIISCSFGDRRLEQALSFAGDNRTELEKVLIYYRGDPEKLEAARFLIRNMPHWYSYKGWQLDSVCHLITQDSLPRGLIREWSNVSFYSLPKVYDAQVITADYLIENIDLAFDVWKEKSWNRNLKFDDFCELILPYRIDNEPLSSWRKLYHDYYALLLDSVYQGEDVVEACRVLCKELHKKGFHYFTDITIPHIDGTLLFRRPAGYCRDACDFTLYAMRACGIPVATEFFRYAPDYQHFHSWNTLRDTTGRFIVFDSEELEPTREPRSDGRRKGKAYRYCFGVQETLNPATDLTDTRIPSFFRNRYLKDVTVNYFVKNKLTVPVKTKERYLYVGVFSPNGWVLIDMAERDGHLVTFCNLEPNIIYQLFQCDGWQQCPVGYPFIYRKGKAEILKPDMNDWEKVILTRKMSIKPTISVWLYRAIIGARIEASNDLTFKHADLLYEFKDTLTTNYYRLNPLNVHKKYTYIRYSPPVGKRMELAELAVYEDTLCNMKIPLHRMNDVSYAPYMEGITDGNILTFFLADPEDASSSVIYKLDKKNSISKIVFAPRNDDNFVWPGDSYELFYQNGVNGWESLGIQKAGNDRKLYYSVPKNALLWLRDRTKGREEQVFVYRNGKQYFTIDIH
ncbi:hypothetical protein [Bacteroides sp. B1-V-101]|uniref:hypothetical protein n=1 Tax=Bacteroides sp. B1-V-101 TaxID=2949660 RepID=UPI00203067A0|nr:hypothetical protein [Bacteroides sp. B1-V-101]MCM0683685.1 hypothetical protein [Bacteroides sp. B1-V-101]